MSLDLNKNALILIPALNPTKEFVDYVKELIENGFKNILVINDGSNKEYSEIFKNIASNKECILINHENNMRKRKSVKRRIKIFFESRK